jgi:homoserine O-acetyltransferase
LSVSTPEISNVLEGILDLEEPFVLHHGDTLHGAKIAYRLAGSAGAPVVAVMGGISAHRFVSACTERGWWKEIVAPGGGVDTDRFAVLGLDFLGGSGDSTAPCAGQSFPPLSPFDQARALASVLDELRIPALHAILGASYGGMVALAFAQQYRARARQIVVFSAAARPHPLATAWRSVQRRIVREAVARGDGPSGLRIARALAMTTYRSPREFAARFSGPPVREADRFRFPVEDYLFARGDHYVQNYRPESFVVLSESIDLHSVDPSRITTPATLIAIREDQLVPLEDMRALAAQLRGPCSWVELSSLFGHDAFLKEGAVINPIIQKALLETRS